MTLCSHETLPPPPPLLRVPCPEPGSRVNSTVPRRRWLFQTVRRGVSLLGCEFDEEAVRAAHVGHEAAPEIDALGEVPGGHHVAGAVRGDRDTMIVAQRTRPF